MLITYINIRKNEMKYNEVNVREVNKYIYGVKK